MKRAMRHGSAAFLSLFLFLPAPAPAAAPAPEAAKKTPADFPLDSRSLDRSGSPSVSGYSAVVERVTPAVVSIFTSRVVEARGTQGLPDDFLRRFFGLPMPDREDDEDGSKGSGRRRLPAGVGSGVIVSADGYILTNHHVVFDERGKKVDEVKVQLLDRRTFTAQVVGGDEKTDVAVVKVDAKDLPAVRMADSEQLRVGDICFAIGNPMGVGLTVTQGIVSALRRSRLGLLGEQGYENFIQTDASINPGNSGGALVDVEGRLIGINTAILSRTGGNMGIGFAIPTSIARDVALKLINIGKVRRGFLGVVIKDIDEDMREAFKLSTTQGALIQSVQEGGAGAKAGLKRGDVIVSVDGTEVRDITDLRIRIADHAPGDRVALGVLRDGKQTRVDAVLDDLEDAPPLLAEGVERLLEGVSVEPLTPALRRQFSLRAEVSGLLVTEVEDDSPYADALRVGMVILEINDRPVGEAGAASSLLRKGANKLYVYYRGIYEYVVVRVGG